MRMGSYQKGWICKLTIDEREALILLVPLTHTDNVTGVSIHDSGELRSEGGQPDQNKDEARIETR